MKIFINFSPSPNAVAPPTSANEQDRSINEDKAKSILDVNTSEPTTTIQIRLADGTKLIATFNHTHTVAELREFIKVYPFIVLHNQSRINLVILFAAKNVKKYHLS